MSTDKDIQEQLEQAARQPKKQKYIFRLYISGATPRSTKAIENIRRLCEEHLKGQYELEIIDIFQHPEKARAEQVIASPTLVKQLPQPLRRYIGDLSDTEKFLVSLEIKAKDRDSSGNSHK
jgi:circadian clock protein KaiB